MSFKSPVITRAVLSVFALLFISACEPSANIDDGEVKVKTRPAKLLDVGYTQDDEYLHFPAVITSPKLSTLSFEVAGVVSDVKVLESQTVKKGQILANLDARVLQTKLNAAKAEFTSANSDFKRAEKLIKQSVISKSELEQKRTTKEVKQSQLETAEKALQDAVLVAPFDGNIANISIVPRQSMQKGEAAIVILGDNAMEAVINLPGSIIATAGKKRASVNSIYLVFGFAPDQRIAAHYKEIALTADAVSQTYQVTFTFTVPENFNILPGMNANLWLKNPKKVNDNSAAILIPLTAIGVDGEQKYVWLVDRSTMLVKRQNIVIADSVGEKIKVRSGLTAGDTIVIAGISSLTSGMKVSAWSK